MAYVSGQAANPDCREHPPPPPRVHKCTHTHTPALPTTTNHHQRTRTCTCTHALPHAHTHTRTIALPHPTASTSVNYESTGLRVCTVSSACAFLPHWRRGGAPHRPWPACKVCQKTRAALAVAHHTHAQLQHSTTTGNRLRHVATHGRAGQSIIILSRRRMRKARAAIHRTEDDTLQRNATRCDGTQRAAAQA